MDELCKRLEKCRAIPERNNVWAKHVKGVAWNEQEFGLLKRVFDQVGTAIIKTLKNAEPEKPSKKVAPTGDPATMTPAQDNMPDGGYLPGELENMTVVELRGEVWGGLNVLQNINPYPYTAQWFKKEYPTILGVAEHPNSCEDKEKLRILVLYLVGIAQEEATAKIIREAGP